MLLTHQKKLVRTCWIREPYFDMKVAPLLVWPGPGGFYQSGWYQWTCGQGYNHKTKRLRSRGIISVLMSWHRYGTQTLSRSPWLIYHHGYPPPFQNQSQTCCKPFLWSLWLQFSFCMFKKIWVKIFKCYNELSLNSEIIVLLMCVIISCGAVLSVNWVINGISGFHLRSTESQT